MKQLFKWTTQWTIVAIALLLSGCVSKILQSKVDEPQTFVLRATDAGAAKIAYPVQLSVALPSAAPGLDSTRIAVLRNDNQLDYFYGARWGATAPAVVQAFVIELLQSQQGFKGVVSEGARIDADYLLVLELRDFQAAYANSKVNPTVQVTLTGTLINIKSRKPAATITASAHVAATDNRLGAVVTAFQSATQKAALSLSEQLTGSFAKQ